MSRTNILLSLLIAAAVSRDRPRGSVGFPSVVVDAFSIARNHHPTAHYRASSSTLRSRSSLSLASSHCGVFSVVRTGESPTRTSLSLFPTPPCKSSSDVHLQQHRQKRTQQPGGGPRPATWVAANKKGGDNGESDLGPSQPVAAIRADELIQEVSLRMRRVSWLSWWAQLILTTVAAVTLLFTRNVTAIETAGRTSAMALAARSLLPNYALVGSGIVLSFGSIFWTWATRRLSRRLVRRPATRTQAANMIRKDVTIGAALNLLGIAVLVVGMQQVIGGLAIKVLTTTAGGVAAPGAFYQAGPAVAVLQPLDILVVQANTNALSSHFCGLVAYLFMGRSIDRLDPPSVDGDERARA